LTVDVPPDARLFIDGNLMKSTAPRRVFATPDLEPGRVYYYDVRAEVVRGGQVVSQVQRVLVRAGQPAFASFVTPANSVAQVGR
jgi:uncharacterized protein (TIGR03000 family)